MTLTDWKKTQEGDFLVYVSGKTKSVITLWKPYLIGNIHNVAIETVKKTHIRKEFKTRSLALKYIKTYMIKH